MLGKFGLKKAASSENKRRYSSYIQRGNRSNFKSMLLVVLDNYQDRISSNLLNPTDLDNPSFIFLDFRNKIGKNLTREAELVLMDIVMKRDAYLFGAHLLNVLNRFSIKVLEPFISYLIKQSDPNVVIAILKPLIRVFDYHIDLALQDCMVNSDLDLQKNILKIYKLLDKTNLFTVDKVGDKKGRARRYVWNGRKFVKGLELSIEDSMDYNRSHKFILLKREQVFLRVMAESNDQDLKHKLWESLSSHNSSAS